MTFAAINGIRVYYEDHGSGTPILLSHGYRSNSQAWNGNLPALTKNYRVITWDNRGHGKTDSPQRQDLYSDAHQVTDVTSLLGELGVEKAVIGGLSMGGALTMQIALQHPEICLALIICDTGPGYRKRELRDEWNINAHVYHDELMTRGLEGLDSTPEVMNVRDHHESAQGLAKAAIGMVLQRNEGVLGRLGQIDIPTLVIVGALDEKFLNSADYISSRVPNARKVVIPDAGHAANIDNPEAFDAAVLQFLDDVL